MASPGTYTPRPVFFLSGPHDCGAGDAVHRRRPRIFLTEVCLSSCPRRPRYAAGTLVPPRCQSHTIQSEDQTGDMELMPHVQNRWQKLYAKSQWRLRARRQIARHPLCAFCLERGVVTAAEVADHIFPHGGDLEKFWNGELRSLCKVCHDRGAKHAQSKGFLPGHDADGMPRDRRHPAYGHKN